ncbi:MAG: hypothetical protein ACD_41C00156G0007 [uncultured bacterium]|nr:MAG: hypothetical protein ACD_41C00156G0007 [uncultured bacterium]HBY73735.1 hypothetical protein [Candidatus Kerfeldbacteria bacterium]
MDTSEQSKTKQIKRSYNIAVIFFFIIMGIILAGCLYLKSFSPTYLFINNTPFQVHTSLVGSSSPTVPLDIAPGERQLVHWSWVSGQLSLPLRSDGQRIEPKYNLIIFKVYYLSDFPDKWGVKKETKMSFVSCMDSLYVDRRDYYSYWKGKFSGLYPNLRVYDAGAYCELNDGNQLISFSHFPADGEVSGTGQTIVLFDKKDNMLKATENFDCQTIGDLGYPVFASLEDNIVTMTCSSGDAGQLLKSTYELDLETFEFSLTNKDTSLPE